MKESHAYEMGYDAAINGPNDKNCNFSLFSTVGNKNDWERGNRLGKVIRESIKQVPTKIDEEILKLERKLNTT